MYDKLFEKYFSFLLQHGFQMQLYSKNSETDAVYQSASTQIEVCVEAGFFKVLFDVIILNGGHRSNLLQYSEIGSSEREELQKQIRTAKKIEQKFAAYGSFVAKHLDKINHS